MILIMKKQKIKSKKDLFVVGKSHIQGRGGFAIRNIQKGEIICTMKGTPKSFKEFEKMHTQGNSNISCDQLQIGIRTYIVLDKPYVCINHSCEPNAGIQGKQTMVALCSISKGEEITYDYSATEWTVQDYPPYYTDGWPMVCCCGSPMCRKKIGCFYYLPKSVKQKYIKSKVIQDHIFKRIKEPEKTKRCFICEANL
jgi:SET domain-containing protein